MTPYRVALILCKAVALSLWIEAAFGLIRLISIFILEQLGLATFGYFNDISWIVEGALALLLGATAPGLSAILAGQSALEGEAIAARRALAPAERNLVRAGAGFIILIYGVAGWVGGLPSLYSFWTINTGAPTNFLPYLIVGMALLTVKIALGFGLAFGPSLRRVVKK